jgi:3-phytase
MDERTLRTGLASLFMAVALSTACRPAEAPAPAPAPAQTPVEPERSADAQVAPPADSMAGLAIRGPALVPMVTSQPVAHDTDDPAFWINAKDPSKSLVIGTDKDADGALYAFSLDGRIVKRVGGLKRPNNVDIEYGLTVSGKSLDIAVTTERLGDTIRIFSVPGLEPIDGGPIPVFEGETLKGPMGLALYKRPKDGAVFAIVGRKSGPKEGYLWQYRLEDDGRGKVKATKVRTFGTWSGTTEIEAISVDDALGYVYYSDEGLGVLKYAADPDAPNANALLAQFGKTQFTQDREGISIYTINDGTGYILVSDQQANLFHIFPREGSNGNSHDHPLLKVVKTSTIESDGSDVTSAALGKLFPQGLFVAMSQGGTFQFYGWPQIAGPDLVVAPNGIRPEGGAGRP